MIIDKQSLPDDPTPVDAPPSYDTLASSSSASTSYRPEKAAAHPDETAVPGPSRPTRPTFSPNSSTSPTGSFPSLPSSIDRKGKGKAPASPITWRPFSLAPTAQARTARELRNTVLRLVRELVEAHPAPNPAAPGILASCSAACTGLLTPLDFGRLLQERSVEGRTPLYWAAVKRRGERRQRQGDGGAEEEEGEGEGEGELLALLLAYATPLNASTSSELRAACLATGDDALFQRLRLDPGAGLSRVSGATQMLLGVSVPPDTVTVREGTQGRSGAGAGAFVVGMVMPGFRRRMTVAGGVEVEWIARGRMWSLSFFPAPEAPQGVHGIPPAGTWCIRLALVDASPPTHVDGLLTIAPDLQSFPAQQNIPPSPVFPEAKSSTILGIRIPGSPGAPPTPNKHEKDRSRDTEDNRALRIRLQAREPLQAPRASVWTQWVGAGLVGSGSGLALANSSASSLSGAWGIGSWGAGNAGGEEPGIVHALTTGARGAGLQYADSAYIAPDGALRARLEVSLEKPQDGDCVIC